MDETAGAYWMCEECADGLGGEFPKGHVCTVKKGVCAYCGDTEKTLIPWVDFNWPRNIYRKAAAKAGRD